MGSGASKTTKQGSVESKSRHTKNKFSETTQKGNRKVEHQTAENQYYLTENQVNQNTNSETNRVDKMDQILKSQGNVGESPTSNIRENNKSGVETVFKITESPCTEDIRPEKTNLQPIGVVQNGNSTKEQPNNDARNPDQEKPDHFGSVNVTSDNEGKSGGDSGADNENDNDADDGNHPTKDEDNTMIDEQPSLEVNQKSNNDNKDCPNTETHLDSKITQNNGDHDKVEEIDSSVPERGKELHVDENTATGSPNNQNTSDVNREEECHPKQDNKDDDKDIAYAKTETVLRVTSEKSEGIDSIDPKKESDSIPGLYENVENKDEMVADKIQPHHSEDSNMIEDCQNTSSSIANYPSTKELSGRAVKENGSTESQQQNTSDLRNEESTQKATTSDNGAIESDQHVTNESTCEDVTNKASTTEDGSIEPQQQMPASDPKNECATQNGSIDSQQEIPDDLTNQDATKITSAIGDKHAVDKQEKKPSLNDLVQRDNNKKLRANLDFYDNQIPSQPYPGYKIEEMLRWRGSYDKLERNHQYIQWLFPMYDSSGMNFYAQPLQLHEAETIQQSQEMRARVLKAFRMMLNFYGMKLGKLEKGEEPKFSRADVWKERYEHLNKSIHNHLRITRIMRSIGYLGYQHLQYPWLKFILEEAHAKDTLLPKLQGGCIRYWIESLEDQDEQDDAIKLLSSFDVPLGDQKFNNEKIVDEKKDTKSIETKHNEVSNEANASDTYSETESKEKSEKSVTKNPNEVAETSDTYSDEVVYENKDSIGEISKTTESKSVKNENASEEMGLPRNNMDIFVGAESAVQVINSDGKGDDLRQSQVDRNKQATYF